MPHHDLPDNLLDARTVLPPAPHGMQPLAKSLFADPPPAPDAPDPRAFLHHFEPARRSGIANWFHQAVRDGGRTPAQVCSHVWQLVARRQQSASDAETATLLAQVLGVLRTRQQEALAYAEHVLHYEALPYEARQRVKAERSKTFIAAAMQGKPVTELQVALLRRLGWAGTVPQDRAAASRLIDELMQKRGQG